MRIISLNPTNCGQARLTDPQTWPQSDRETRGELASQVVDTFHQKLNRELEIDGQWIPRRASLRLFNDTVEIFDRVNLRRIIIDETGKKITTEVNLEQLIEDSYADVRQSILQKSR